MGYKTDRKEIKNSAMEPDTERWRKKERKKTKKATGYRVSPSWAMGIFHTIDSHAVYEWRLARGPKSALLISMSWNPLLAGRSNYFVNLAKFTSSRFCYRCLGTGCKSVIRW